MLITGDICRCWMTVVTQPSICNMHTWEYGKYLSISLSVILRPVTDTHTHRFIDLAAWWLDWTERHPTKLCNFVIELWFRVSVCFSYQRLVCGPCGARSRCRISPPCFLAECCKRRLNQGSFVSAVRLVVCFLWFVLCLCVHLCDLYSEFFPYCLFVNNSQVIGCEDRLRNDLYCVGWGVKLCSIQSLASLFILCFLCIFSCLFWVVSTSASDCLPRLVSKMT